MTNALAGVEVHRAVSRFNTTEPGIVSRHSFSFGSHYAPDNVSFGQLLANNEEIVDAEAGFNDHSHRDVEIVTWVLSGTLEHRDAAGNVGLSSPGTVQRLSAGSGIVHSETSAEASPVHFIQMWVAADDPDREPSYVQNSVDAPALMRGELVPIASGQPDVAATVTINNSKATLYAAWLEPDRIIELPAAEFVHLFVTRGAILLRAVGPLDAGDAVRFTAATGYRITSAEPAEVLIWAMN